MKTTLEIPDATFRRAKARAAQQGVPLRQFVTDAVEEKLGNASDPRKFWSETALSLGHLKTETKRINRIIEKEFSKIDSEDWA